VTGAAPATTLTSRPVGVRAQGWGWRYGTRAAWAVRALDLVVEPGERVLLRGASGSGKSTVLAGLAGLLDDATGDQEGGLLLDGVPARQARRDGVVTGTARTGLLLQDPLAQTVLARCGDDVAFGLENHAVPRELIWPRVEAALRGVGFPYRLDHSTARLSGGERQRLALAGVIVLRPGLLLLDEPTAMLDLYGATMLRELLAQVVATTGATCVLVEHQAQDWLPLIDRVIQLGEPVPGADRDSVGGVAPAPAPARGGEAEASAVAPIRGREVASSGGLLLSARDVSVTRDGRPVVRGAQVELHAGEALCLVGPNGSGKSSLALALAGLLPVSAGEVRAHDALLLADPGRVPRSFDPFRWRPRELVSRIGSVFQEPQHQFVAATCADELAVGPRRIGLPEPQVRQRVDALLDRLGLAGLARANPFSLSGGEQRRLSVGTALATQPRLLVLDEPTFGQDERTWAQLVALLRELLDGGTALVAATHDAALVDALGGRSLAMSRPAAS